MHTVQSREQILPLDRQVQNPDLRVQHGYQLPSRCCQRDLMPVGNLFL